VPGYEPFLLCDFHVHTRWSDGRLSLREVVDLYGKTRRFDVIAITDHILMERDMFARAGRMISLGRHEFSVTADRFDAYLNEIETEARRARRLYDLLVLPGAEISLSQRFLGGVVDKVTKANKGHEGCELPLCPLSAFVSLFFYQRTFTPNCT
jgi:histidinol phosphatase-like PHP family hydrolase